MTYEFGQVEGDIERLTEKALGSALPSGVNFASFMNKLKSGELALLTDTPSKPVLLRDGMSKSWSLSAEGQEALSPEAKNAFLSRAKMSGGSGGGAAPNRSSAGYAPNIEETYVPEPVKPDTSDAPPKLKYEYCFEVACSDETFRKSVGCSFELAKTKEEVVIGRWQTAVTEHGTKYTAYSAVDEPKRLTAKVAAIPMGISVPHNVKLKPIGSGLVREAFIPVVPSVQLGERLGLPTEGYYYHFYNNRLVQEYKLLGEGKWAFYATCSTHERLNDEQGYNVYQSAILVYWKLEGKDVENQHLIYLEQQITRDELDNLNDDWLAQHGIKLDIKELLAAPKQPVAERQTTQPVETANVESKPETHTVATDLDTHQRETWGAIAEQYGLSAKQLLDLNPQYDANPMKLKVGDQLVVSNKTEIEQQTNLKFGKPSVEVKEYNKPSNSIYDYSSSYIKGTTFKSVNSEGVVHDDLTIANLKEVEEQIEFQLGFVRVEESQSLSDYWEQVLSGVSSKTKSLIQEHNQHLNDPLIPGEMVIFLTKEPSSEEDKAKLKSLKDNSVLASEELGKLSPDQIELHQAYFEVIENKLVEYWNTGKPSDSFAYMGSAVGTIAPAMQKNLENVSSSLKKMDRLYLDLLAKKIDRSSFVRQRKGLKKILDKQLDKLTQRTLKVPVDQGLKTSLGIDSTKSLIHNADEILKAGSVPELGARVANTAKWITYAEKAGKVAIGLSVASGVYNVSENCGSIEACARSTAKETGGVIGGWAGGTAGAAAAGAFVAFVGITSAPVVMLVVGFGALGAGIYGAGSGKDIAEKAYEFFELDLFLKEIESNIEKDIPDDIEEYINKQIFNDFSVGSSF
ncbi:LysM peptidoglycan-binding domain-containing protein [Vibrio parahaemolyticus]|uniref:LysM peptidoglycan-binding domain-containing protein n=1 Tax=Vibrio parahaemolyticus TaxID=670 RepID=UPI00215D57EE|nr:LysM peptidoglycan-binding domain-containing protein [Vibrio parahaemolyticus]EJB8503668.1 LysM peptidoglycan-binding domain-containing protein [Vibrio parahaemolyticus]MCR9867136.1 LysM peptidoglycan-binding domain-containing protein [Vibrio parahaemolyticus]